VRSLVLALAAVALCPGAAAAQATVVIDVFNLDFGNAMTGEPIDPVINVGDKVRWNWVNGSHSTTAASGQADMWDSNVLDSPVPPDFTPVTFEHTFNTPGTFVYYCKLHGFDLGNGQAIGMSGTVTVQVAPVPEPASVLAVAGLAGAGAAAWRRVRSVRRDPPTEGTP
jgi:plastocyanin